MLLANQNKGMLLIGKNKIDNHTEQYMLWYDYKGPFKYDVGICASLRLQILRYALISISLEYAHAYSLSPPFDQITP